MAYNAEKYMQAILYLCEKLGSEVRGKKKLAKLLYFVDFDFFEKNEEFFIGEKYKALSMGPFPAHLEKITQQMVKEGKLQITSIPEWNEYNPTEVYKAKEPSDKTIFSVEEIAILDRVIKNYGQLNGKQLEDITHAEAPFTGTKQNEEIVYELAFYRGTEF